MLLLSDPRFAAVPVADCGEPLAGDERVLLDERERNPSGAYPQLRAGTLTRLDLDPAGHTRLSYQQAEALFSAASGGATLH